MTITKGLGRRCAEGGKGRKEREGSDLERLSIFPSGVLKGGQMS